MKRIKQLIILFSGLTALTACQEQIDIAIPPTDKKVVIEAEVSTEQDSSYVRITETADYYSTAPVPVVSNATVQVNGISFSYLGNGLYKPASPFVGEVNKTYQLTVTHNGKTYTSSSTLIPMFSVDSVTPLYKPAEGFLEEGYTVLYFANDTRPQTKYTYYRFGIVSHVTHADSLFENKILFDNASTQYGRYTFEIPFLRLQVGDTCIQQFRSVDKAMFEFLRAYNSQTSGAPGPFQVPPANLPTNITGGAIGYFATYDVKRTMTPIR